MDRAGLELRLQSEDEDAAAVNDSSTWLLTQLEQSLAELDIIPTSRSENLGRIRPDSTALLLGWLIRSLLTTAGHRVGETIQFESYYITRQALQNGWVGPQSPPLLNPGWEGRVYLKPHHSGSGLTIAAYGKSFEPVAGRRTFYRRTWRRR